MATATPGTLLAERCVIPADSRDDNVVLESDGDYDNYAIRPDGSNLRRPTDHPADDQIPCFTPEGLWLFFQSQRDGD